MSSFVSTPPLSDIPNVYPPLPVKRKSINDGWEEYQKRYKESMDNPNQFWTNEANKYITWLTPFKRVNNGTFLEGDVNWFSEGKLNADGSLKIQNGGSSPTVSLFKAEWCGHCKNFTSTWNQLQKTNKHVKFETFDADKHGDIIKKQNIDGFPTIKINGNVYHGERDFETLNSLLNGSQ
jgi:glutaredoxin